MICASTALRVMSLSPTTARTPSRTSSTVSASDARQQVSERLRDWYAVRGKVADQQAREALGSAQVVEQLAEAMRRLVDAERLVLREVEHAAIVDAEIAESIDRALMLRLASLDEAHGCAPEELEKKLHELLEGEMAVGSPSD